MPAAAVDDETVDFGEEVAFPERGERPLPPECEGEVAVDVSEECVREELGAGAGDGEGDLFRADAFAAAGGELTVGGDPRADFGRAGGGGDGDEDGAAGVFAGDLADEFGVRAEAGADFAADGEVHGGGAGDGGAGFPELFEAAWDGGEWDWGAEVEASGWVRRCGGAHGDQRRRHSRPSAARRASASAGPHVPAG